MHSASVTDEWPISGRSWPIIASCRRQETDKKPTTSPHGSVFHFSSGMPRPLQPWGPWHKMQNQKNSLCHRDHKPIDSSCLHLIPQPLFVISCLCCWFHWQHLHSLHGLWIHGLHSLWIYGLIQDEQAQWVDVNTLCPLEKVFLWFSFTGPQTSKTGWRQRVMSAGKTVFCVIHAFNISLVRA